MSAQIALPPPRQMPIPLIVAALDARGDPLQQVVAVEGIVGDAAAGPERARRVQHAGRGAGVGGERNFSFFCVNAKIRTVPLLKLVLLFEAFLCK